MYRPPNRTQTGLIYFEGSAGHQYDAQTWRAIHSKLYSRNGKKEMARRAKRRDNGRAK